MHWVNSCVESSIKTIFGRIGDFEYCSKEKRLADLRGFEQDLRLRKPVSQSSLDHGSIWRD